MAALRQLGRAVLRAAQPGTALVAPIERFASAAACEHALVRLGSGQNSHVPLLSPLCHRVSLQNPARSQCPQPHSDFAKEGLIGYPRAGSCPRSVSRPLDLRQELTRLSLPSVVLSRLAQIPSLLDGMLECLPRLSCALESLCSLICVLNMCLGICPSLTSLWVYGAVGERNQRAAVGACCCQWCLIHRLCPFSCPLSAGDFSPCVWFLVSQAPPHARGGVSALASSWASTLRASCRQFR